jgi:hypothetical protein
MSLDNNRPHNIVKIPEKNLNKYSILKEGENFEEGDYVHLLDDEYVKIEKNNILLKQKVNKYNKVLRKK